MRLTGDIVMLREMVVAALITLLTQSLVLVGIFAIMTTINLRLTLIAAIVAPALLLILSVFRIRLVDAAGRQRKREGRLASKVHEVLGGIQLVQAYTAEDHEAERFKELNKRSLRGGVRLTRIEAQLNRSVQIAMGVGLCAVLWIGTQDVLNDRLSPGQLLVFMAYLRGLYKPLRQVSKLTQRVAKAAACGDRVLEVLDEEPQIQDPPRARTLRDIAGRIELREVFFSYSDGRPVLRDVNLRIAPGEMVALVGPTGEGKSTLLSLIPRFYDPDVGEILIDDIPIRTVRLKSLRRHISVLLQDTVVMGVTIRENIAYGAVGGKGPPSDRKIRRVAKAARAHEFISRLPDGYDTVVGERGATLSGGQRQRIAIARALLRKAPILLLDEPTTALDPLSGGAVLGALEALTRERTRLVVAHQLSTVLRADRIVYLAGGRIEEEGSHEELLRRGGSYAAFFKSEWGGLAARGVSGSLPASPRPPVDVSL
jgi:ATP-binding cassette subfamily B protein